MSEPVRDAVQLLKFEMKTAWRRNRQKKQYAFPDLEFLNCGCGTIRLDGFINSDIIVNEAVDLFHDGRFPIPLADRSVSGVYSHHYFEHLSLEHALLQMSEWHRIMKDGGIVRIVVPDAAKFIALYSEQSETSQLAELYPKHHRKEFWNSPIDVVNHVFRDNKFNRHLFAWDFKALKCRLVQAGFCDIRQMSLNKSQRPEFEGHDNTGWADHSIYVEAAKHAEK